MNRQSRTAGSRIGAVALVAMVAVSAAACGGDNAKAGSTDHPASPSSGVSSATSRPPATSTPALDSIVVLGHSGTTGYNSDPAHSGGDARDNSWATGTNPQVNSIYQRLLATHPALADHTTSLGIDGSTVDSLPGQVDDMLKLDPLPDVVLIQSIDNDIQCDGSDAANEKTFGQSLSAVLDTIDAKDANAQVFFVDQWASVQDYADYVAQDSSLAGANKGGGLCDLISSDGKVRPGAVTALQKIVDGYFAQIQTACQAHPRCWTDGGALQKLKLAKGDTTSDGNHLSVQGLAKMAAIAWGRAARGDQDPGLTSAASDQGLAPV